MNLEEETKAENGAEQNLDAEEEEKQNSDAEEAHAGAEVEEA